MAVRVVLPKQPGRAVALPLVSHVLRLRPENEMHGVYARRVVTGVAYYLTLDVRVPKAVVFAVRDPVGRSGCALEVLCAVLLEERPRVQDAIRGHPRGGN